MILISESTTSREEDPKLLSEWVYNKPGWPALADTWYLLATHFSPESPPGGVGNELQWVTRRARRKCFSVCKTPNVPGPR
jgi:hypothetical protein